MLALVFYVLFALAFSFFCSVAEAVLLSVTPSYIAQLENQGRPVAKLLRQLKENIDRPLAAILSLNTFAHTLGAAGAGAQAAAVFGSRWVGLASVVLTLLILFLSEIIPKTLGAVYWKSLAPSVSRTIRVLILVLYPFVIFSEQITRVLGRKGSSLQVSREELTAMADLGTQAGALHQRESHLLKNLLHFNTLRLEDVMTPRTVVVAMPEKMTVGEFFDRFPQIPFSRLPVFGRDLDDVTGYVLKTDILLAGARGERLLPLLNFRREIVAFPAIARLDNVFEAVLARREQIVLAVDEFGGTAGVATLEDLVETLLGLEFVDEADQTEDMRKLARERWQKRARSMGLVPEEGSEKV